MIFRVITTLRLDHVSYMSTRSVIAHTCMFHIIFFSHSKNEFHVNVHQMFSSHFVPHYKQIKAFNFPCFIHLFACLWWLSWTTRIASSLIIVTAWCDKIRLSMRDLWCSSMNCIFNLLRNDFFSSKLLNFPWVWKF